MTTPQKSVAVVGATGYTAHELIRLLLRHPKVALTAVTSETETGRRLSVYYPDLVEPQGLVFQSLTSTRSQDFDLVFLCTPHGESQKIAPVFLKRGIRVIDLSGDYRVPDSETYAFWYQQPQTDLENLKQAVYGLPEWNRKQIADARLVANPGCYPTGALLSLLPLVRAGFISGTKIIIDAKSGVSGAGKKPTARTHFVEVNENLSAYAVGHSHRHIGEMEHVLRSAGQNDYTVLFTPQLIPLTRGILETIYLETKHSREEILSALQTTYRGEPFVRVWDRGLPDIHAATGTNLCHIGLAYDEKSHTAILVTAFDNLLKGASGQAVQNMNLLFGWDETEGLR